MELILSERPNLQSDRVYDCNLDADKLKLYVCTIIYVERPDISIFVFPWDFLLVLSSN